MKISFECVVKQHGRRQNEQRRGQPHDRGEHRLCLPPLSRSGHPDDCAPRFEVRDGIEQRTHHQVTGEPMKFLTLADWTGMVETELFAPTYRSYGLATVRYPVLEVTATVELFENGNGFSLRVQRAGKPRMRDHPTEP